MIKKHLETLGFSAHESAVLATLYEQSPVGVSFIARKTGLARSTIYTVLGVLSVKSYVGISYKNDVRQYIPADVSRIKKKLDTEKETLIKKEKELALLQSSIALFAQNDLSVPAISVFEGAEGLKKMYLEMMHAAPANTELLLARDDFVWQKEWSFIFARPWRRAIERIRKEKNIPTKLLINDTEQENAKESYYKKVPYVTHRFLSRTHALNKFALYVLHDTVLIMSFENNHLIGIKIVNAHLAANYRALYENMWQKAR